MQQQQIWLFFICRVSKLILRSSEYCIVGNRYADTYLDFIIFFFGEGICLCLRWGRWDSSKRKKNSMIFYSTPLSLFDRYKWTVGSNFAAPLQIKMFEKRKE